MNRSRARRRWNAWERYRNRTFHATQARIHRGHIRSMVPFAKGATRDYLRSHLR